MTPQLLLPAQRTWRRELRAGGDVAVSPGDEVDADRVVAEGKAAAAPVVIDLGPAQPLVAAGQDVQAGDLVGRRKKLFGSGIEVRAPVAGKVLLIEGRELLLAPPPVNVALKAELPGTVEAVQAGWSVGIRGCFGLLRGWSCSGTDCAGRLGEEFAIEPEPLTEARLQALAGQGAKGVVAPGWDSTPVLPTITVFFTEPLPGRAMAAPIATALKASLGMPAVIRCEHVPVLAFAGQPAEPAQAFGPGSWVRTANGATGRLVRVHARPRYFPSGLRALPAEVDLGDSTQALPLEGLEWIA